MTMITAGKRQAYRLSLLPPRLAESIAAGDVPNNLFNQSSLGLNLYHAAEASVVAIKGGGEAAERWLEKQYSTYRLESRSQRSAFLFTTLAELQSSNAPSCVPPSPPPPARAQGWRPVAGYELLKCHEANAAKHAAFDRAYAEKKALYMNSPVTPAASSLAPNANAPLAAVYLSILDDTRHVGKVVASEACDTLWREHRAEFLNPSSTRAYGSDPAERQKLIAKMFNWFPTEDRADFYAKLVS